MRPRDNILLVEIENPIKISEMKEYLLKMYPQIDIIYDVGTIITVNCNGISKEVLMENIKSENGVRKVTPYKPIEKP